jgi:hypothetical protein
MSKAIRITLIVIGILVVATGLVFAGTWIGHRTAYNLGWSQSVYPMMNATNRQFRDSGSGMMSNGMMSSRRSSGSGMMGNYGYSNPSVAPLTVDQAYQAAGTYLAALNDPGLKIAEVMVFDNNAYVRVIEQSTGIGAFELLVDPTSLVVYPEHGPNMMWNLKYAGLNHQSMMGGRGGMTPALRSGASAGVGGSAFSATPAAVSADMPVTSAQALQAAQAYLDTALPGAKTAVDADRFYGYYTIDILRDGKIIGMLSVNGFNSQVFMHTWHGTFITTQDY